MIFSWIKENCEVYDYCITKDCVFEFIKMKALIWSFNVCRDLYNLWKNELIKTSQFSPYPIYLINDKLERL